MSVDQWEEAAAAVSGDAETLKDMSTHAEIYTWANERNLATKTMWPKIKVELKKQLKIDYEELRDQTRKRRAAELIEAQKALNEAAEGGATISINAAGDAEANTFAVCCGEDVLWYGEFYKDAKAYKGTQLQADQDVANKAVFIAAEAKKAAGLDTLILDLTVINHEVKAPVASCVKHGLALKFSIADQGAPALAWCRENGYKTWREVDLTELIEQ